MDVPILMLYGHTLYVHTLDGLPYRTTLFGHTLYGHTLTLSSDYYKATWVQLITSPLMEK